MKLEVEVLMRAVLLAVLLVATGAAGQGFPLPIPPARSVIAYPPDGGTEVFIPGRVDTNITGALGETACFPVAGIGCARLQVEATGLSGGPVVTSTTLTSASLSALNGRICVPGAQAKVGVDGNVRSLPPIPADGGTGAMLGRTTLALTYLNTTGTPGVISCVAGALDGGASPVCTHPTAGATTDGWALDEGNSMSMEIGPNYVLRCIGCLTNGTTRGNTITVSVLEMDCDPYQ